MNKKFYIYQYYFKSTNEVFYISKGCIHLKTLIIDHVYNSVSTNRDECNGVE